MDKKYIEYEAALSALLYARGRNPIEDIKSVPAADVIPMKHGKWIKEIDPWDRQYIGKCTECGKRYRDYMYFRFCPNCSAKMDGGQ